MYKAAIISLGSVSSQWTAEAMRKYFDKVDELNIKDVDIQISGNNSEVLHNGKPIEEYDCVYLKGSFRYAPLQRSLTTVLSKKCYMPIKPDAFTTVHDKLLTQLQLQVHGIPMPTTYLSATIKSAKSILEGLNYPIVMKFPQGTGGKGVLFSESYSSASSMLDALSALKQSFLIQEYIETGGKDIRVIVVGEKVVSAYQRKADIKEMRANVHSGGTGEKLEVIDDDIRKLSLKTARAVQADICGVDILKSGKKTWVIEANLSPGLQMATETTGVNIADQIAKFMFEKTKSLRTGERKTDEKEILKTIDEEKPQEVISQLEFRGERILLPEVVTKIAKFKEEKDYVVKVKKGKLIVENFDVG